MNQIEQFDNLATETGNSSDLLQDVRQIIDSTRDYASRSTNVAILWRNWHLFPGIFQSPIGKSQLLTWTHYYLLLDVSDRDDLYMIATTRQFCTQVCKICRGNTRKYTYMENMMEATKI